MNCNNAGTSSDVRIIVLKGSWLHAMECVIKLGCSTSLICVLLRLDLPSGMMMPEVFNHLVVMWQLLYIGITFQKSPVVLSVTPSVSTVTSTKTG